MGWRFRLIASATLLATASGAMAAEQFGPWTSLAWRDNGPGLTLAPSGCATDLDCRPVALSCPSGALVMEVRSIPTGATAAWRDGTLFLIGADTTVAFRVVTVTEGTAGWTATLEAEVAGAGWIEALAEAPAIAIAGPAFPLSFAPTETDRRHLRAFAEGCAGEAAAPSCPLRDATYRMVGATARFLPGAVPELVVAAGDAPERRLVHTGGAGRGAAFYDPLTDQYFSYWLDGIEGQIAEQSDAPARLTLFLDGIGEFERACGP